MHRRVVQSGVGWLGERFHLAEQKIRETNVFVYEIELCNIFLA